MSIAIWIIAACQIVIAVGWIFQVVRLKADLTRVQALFEFDKERQEWARSEHARLCRWYKDDDKGREQSESSP